MDVPVNVIAGWMARGSAPAARAGSSTSSPWTPEVCTTIWPTCHSPRVAAPATTSAMASSGTVTSTTSARRITSWGVRTSTPGRSSSARSREASETAVTPTTA